MNTRAGYLLNTRNATRAPHKVIATAFSPAGAPGRSNAIVAIAVTASPPASPSMPAVMFTAVAVAAMAATASGKTTHGVAGGKNRRPPRPAARPGRVIAGTSSEGSL